MLEIKFKIAALAVFHDGGKCRSVDFKYIVKLNNAWVLKRFMDSSFSNNVTKVGFLVMG